MTEHAKSEKEIENKSVAFYPLKIEGQNENMENGTEDIIYHLQISREPETWICNSKTECR
jgi:hypothetical protein